MEEGTLPSAPVAKIATPRSPSASTTPKRSRRGIFVIAIFLLIVVCGSVAALAYFVLRHTPPAKSILAPPLTDDQILASALATFFAVKSGTMRFAMRFVGEARDPDAKPISFDLPGFAQRREALEYDRERIKEITQLMMRLQQENAPPAARGSPVDAGSAEPSFPRRLDEIIQNPGLRNDPAGAPYRYASDGSSFTLTFHLETQAAVDAWNKQLDGTRRFRAGKQPPPAVIRQDIVLTSSSETPIVYLGPADGLDPLVEFTDGLDQLFQLIPSDVDAGMNIRGQFDTKTEDVAASNASFGLGGSLTMGGVSFTGDGEFRKVGEIFYGRVNQFPLPLGPVDFNAIKGKWVLIAPEDLIGTEFADELLKEREELHLDNQRESRQLQIAVQLAQAQKLVQIKTTLPMVEEDGRRFHRYQLRFDRTKLVAYYRALAERFAAEFGDDAPFTYDAKAAAQLEQPEFTKIYDALEPHTVVEVWVENGTNLPGRFSYQLRLVPPDTIAKHAGRQFKISASLALDKVNQPVVIEVPAPTISVDEAAALVTSQPPAVISLSRQIRNVEAIRGALRRYHVRTGQYPPTVDELKRKPSEINAVNPVPQTEMNRSEFWTDAETAKSDAPFLRIVPNDRYTGIPYPYERVGDGYTLRYQVRLPSGSEQGRAVLASVSFEKYVAGENTADADTSSREGSSSADSDADGLSDFQERNTFGTDPEEADTDGDGFADGVEVENGFDPKGSGRLPAAPTPAAAASSPVGFQPRAYDARRISDIKQLQTAAEIYFNDKNSYPLAPQPVSLGRDVTCLDGRGFGTACEPSSVIYMGRIPADPGGWEYRYSTVPGKITEYCVEFMLYRDTGALLAGKNFASEAGTGSTCVH